MACAFGIEFEYDDNSLEPDKLRAKFEEILNSYVMHCSRIKNKEEILDEIYRFFNPPKKDPETDSEKCEKNVSNFEEKYNPKIIQFPKRYQEL